MTTRWPKDRIVFDRKTQNPFVLVFILLFILFIARDN